MQQVLTVQFERSEPQLPFRVHDRIMKRVVLLRFRWVFVALYALLSVNMVIACYNVLGVLELSSFQRLVSALFAASDFSLLWFTDFAQTMYEQLPMASVFSLVITLGVTAVLTRFVFNLHRSLVGKAVE